MHTLKLDIALKSSPDKVWALVGPFGSLAEWHPEVASSETSTDEGGNTLRTVVFKNGQKVVERLTRHDDQSRGYLYSIVKSKLPVQDFMGQLQVVGMTDESRLQWMATFEVVPGFPEERALSIVDGILQSAAPGLTAKLGAM